MPNLECQGTSEESIRTIGRFEKLKKLYLVLHGKFAEKKKLQPVINIFTDAKFNLTELFMSVKLVGDMRNRGLFGQAQ